jgi:hypothetical protein
MRLRIVGEACRIDPVYVISEDLTKPNASLAWHAVDSVADNKRAAA